MANPTLQEILESKLETAYKLARASVGSEQERKAIDFFYSVHLNRFSIEAIQAISAAMDSIIGEDSNSLEMSAEAVGGFNYAKAEARKRKDTFLGGGNG